MMTERSLPLVVPPDEDDAPEAASDIEEEEEDEQVEEEEAQEEEGPAAPQQTGEPKEQVQPEGHEPNPTTEKRRSSYRGAHSRSPHIARIELQPSDFYFGSTLGEGAYARVVHAKSKKTGDQFAVKIMEKMHIKRENKIKHVLMERKILTMVSHPFIIKFHFSFQDAGYLYMCMDLIPGGNLLDLINRAVEERGGGINGGSGDLDEDTSLVGCDQHTTRFYMAEIVEGLEYLHKNDIIHRDLKPENVLISPQGHIKITDFGMATILSDHESPRNSFVGTQDYVSPEVLAGDRQVTGACDLWALGCMLFQMLTGHSPFRQPTEYLTFEAIMSHCKGSQPLHYPPSIDTAAGDLISALLQPDEKDRLGCRADTIAIGYQQLKSHPFFESTLWGELLEQTPPYAPGESCYPSPDNMQDGATNQWLLEGEPTPIEPFVSRADLTKERRASRAGSLWQQFLYEGEKQVFTSAVYKRKGLFSKRRQLILTDRPRLIYIDPASMELKGEIPWTQTQPVSCSVKNAKEFDVHCAISQRSYHLSDSEVGAQTWVDFINAMLRKQRDGNC